MIMINCGTVTQQLIIYIYIYALIELFYTKSALVLKNYNPCDFCKKNIENKKNMRRCSHRAKSWQVIVRGPQSYKLLSRDFLWTRHTVYS